MSREILDYRYDRICRGITYGALWAALVRASAIYAKVDEPAQQKLNEGGAPDATAQRPKRAPVRRTLAEALKPIMSATLEPAKGQVIKRCNALAARLNLTAAPKARPEEAEKAIAEAREVYEAKRWPEGKAPGGKGQRSSEERS